MALFYDTLTNVDKKVGEILSRLEEGLAQNTTFSTGETMAPTIPAAESTSKKQEMFGREHDSHVGTNIHNSMLNGQRDVIGREWRVHRVMKRIELSTEQKV